MRLRWFLAGLFLYVAAATRADVYTIDFNQGTLFGPPVAQDVARSGVATADFCASGAEYFSLHPSTSSCYYDGKGCGIRLAASASKGIFILTLNERTSIAKVVVYASKMPRNGKSELSLYVGGDTAPVATFANDVLKDYSAEHPASEDYVLPAVDIGRACLNLKLQSPAGGYVMLHRIEIHTPDEDAVRAPVAADGDAEACFNLLGQHCRSAVRGVYVRGGRKFVVK